MANINKPFGFQPLRNGAGSPWNQQANMYCIPSTNNTVISIGDAVIAAAGSDAQGIPNIAKASGTAAVRGVVVGFTLTPPNTTSLQGTIIDNTIINIPATKTKAYYALVIDDPDALFIIQDDGITTANLVAASANLNANFTVANPSGISGVSASVILSSSIANTSTLPLKIIGLHQDPGSSGANAFGAYARWVVKFNQHELMGNQAGV